MTLPSHPTPASSECWQLCVRIGLLGHSSNWLALEVHWTSSRKMGPVPVPKKALLKALPAALETVHKVISNIHCCGILKLTSNVSISKLPADHSSISSVPAVITHCPPLVIDTHLHSALILTGASHQTYITICAVATGTDCSQCILTTGFGP